MKLLEENKLQQQDPQSGLLFPNRWKNTDPENLRIHKRIQCTECGQSFDVTVGEARYRATGVDYYQPILVLMSDGAPNGDPKVLKKAAQRVQELCGQHRLTVVAVGIGADADLDMLAMFTPKRCPVRLSGLQFREFFAWLSQSVSNVSASLPGDEKELDLDALYALEAEPWPDTSL